MAANVIKTHANRTKNHKKVLQTAKAVVEAIPSRKPTNKTPKEVKVYIQTNACSMKKEISLLISSRKQSNKTPKEVKVYIQTNACSMKKQISLIISDITAIVRKQAYFVCIAMIILTAASNSEFIILSAPITKGSRAECDAFWS